MLGTSVDGYFTELNPAWERWLGWTREELMAEPFISFVHPDDVEATRERGAAFAEPGSDAVRHLREPLPHPRRRLPVPQLDDGRRRRRPVLRREGRDRPQGAPRARRRGQRLIRHSEALHRTLTANLPDTTVFLLDPDLRILVADGEAIRASASSTQDMFRGRRVAELYAEVPDEVLQLCLENYRAALRGERRAFEFISDGLTFAVQAVPVRAEDGTIESLLVVARDISERTHAAAAARAPRPPAERGRGRSAASRSRATTSTRADGRGGDGSRRRRSASTSAACSSSTGPASA